jgi:hypothetical protein
MLLVIDYGEPLEDYASGKNGTHLRVHLIHPFEVTSFGWMTRSV